MTRISPLNIGCNEFDAKLTIYHLAAYVGLTGLVKTLLNSKLVRGIDVNCSNAHGITPLYLAKLNIMRDNSSDGKSDPWQDIADLIKKHGGMLTYPKRTAELHLLYEHLFGSFLNPFRLDTRNSQSELFYNSDVSQCTASNFDYYKTGTLLNPYMKEIQSELQRITESLNGKLTNTQAIREVMHAKLELLQLGNDLSNIRKKTEMEVVRGRNQARYAITSVKIPKVMKSLSTKVLHLRNRLNTQKRELSELRSSHDSNIKAMNHLLNYMKKILYQHRDVFGDTTKMLKLFEKYEESNLCMEEIVEAMMINFHFRCYVDQSRATDFLSLMRSANEREFAKERIPSEWLESIVLQEVVVWNQGIKFLYQQGTQRYDSTFDYLHVLSLGLDRNTRIPFSVETFRFD